MAERIMLRVGDFDFEITTAAYQKYIARHSARWAEQERIGRNPALQFVGIGTVEITLDGVVYPALAGSRKASLLPYGREDVLPVVLEANPHLASLPPVLTAGIRILLPDITELEVTTLLRLWD